MWRTGSLWLLLEGEPETPNGGLTAREWAIATSFGPRNLAESAKELYLESARQARQVRSLGDVPLIVLTAGKPPRKASGPAEARRAIRGQQAWIEMQGQLTRLSSRARQVVFSESRHCIQCDAPHAIVDAVREVVRTARTGRW